MPSSLEVRDWHTRTVVSNDGHEVGKLEDVYVQKGTERPEFLLVGSGLLAHRLHLVPVDGSTLEGENVRVAHDKATIESAPTIPADDDLSPDEERRLFEHYGRSYDQGTLGALTISRWVLIQRQ